ncbi:MAG: 30S ribosomal protein S6 [Patescibacteria group bacterium]|nr:30S ribosomal protein S6 [Patescibacteria group bacterium]MDE2144580.1 30S ribosomal protein S6 [Patescibacteria group bacterium]
MDSDRKSYEISFLVRSENDVEAVLKRLSNIGAEIVSEGNIAEVKLAYPINKLNSAYFGWICFDVAPEKITELNSALRLDEKVMRHLVLTPPITKTEKKRPMKSSLARTEAAGQAPASNAPSELSNEELEKKLEEILN